MQSITNTEMASEMAPAVNEIRKIRIVVIANDPFLGRLVAAKADENDNG
jgi:hypothetical protein